VTKRFGAVVAAVAVGLALTGCGDDKNAADDVHTASNGDEYNDADVRFASDMIPHHAQALAMVDLTVGRRLDPEVGQLVEDIREVQAPEIELMTDWLTSWGEEIPETVRDHANAHGHGGMEMNGDVPGMMSEEEMAELERADDAAFHDLFLTMMIAHHEGAITMARVEQDEGHFQPATELAKAIETAQSEEITRMEGLLR
jgi:uncharacterized protein (DUF305 family)